MYNERKLYCQCTNIKNENGLKMFKQSFIVKYLKLLKKKGVFLEAYILKITALSSHFKLWKFNLEIMILFKIPIKQYIHLPINQESLNRAMSSTKYEGFLPHIRYCCYGGRSESGWALCYFYKKATWAKIYLLRTILTWLERSCDLNWFNPLNVLICKFSNKFVYK